MSDDQDPSTPCKSRRWRGWVWRCLLAMFIIATGIFTVYYIIRSRDWAVNESALAVAISETDSLNPRWRLEEIEADRAVIPVGLNSAEVIEEIDNRTEKSWESAFSKEGNLASRLSDLPRNEAPSPSDIDELERWLTAHKVVVELARSLIHYPAGRFPLVVPVSPTEMGKRVDYHGLRIVRRVLELDMKLQSLRGQRSAAWDDLHAILLAFRSEREEPSLMGQLIRLAGREPALRGMEWLMAQDIAPQVVFEAQGWLLEEIEDPLFLWAIRGERALINRQMENWEAGKIHIRDIDHSEKSRWDFFYNFRFKPYVPCNHAYSLQWFNQIQKIALKTPIEDQQAALNAIPEPPIDLEHALARYYIPPVAPTHHNTVRDQALMRCAIVAIAVEGYRLRCGKWPKSLAELPADLLKEIPLDPFDGKPLRYRITDVGVVVYSVGLNRVDDGGKLSDNYFRDPNSDYGLQLWNPELRRLRPAPKDAKAPTPGKPASPIKSEPEKDSPPKMTNTE